MNDVPSFSPADIARRVAALGLIADPTMVWAYLRTRLAEAYPERLTGLPDAALPVAEADLDEWLDDFLDGALQQRAELLRRIDALNQSDRDG